MKPIFDPNELSLLTDDEKHLQKEYVKMIKAYVTGGEYEGHKVDGIQLKNANAGMANIAKMVQSRSAMALLKYNILKGDEDVRTKMLETKP